MKETVIITGASGSMGRIAAAETARRGYPVVLACRDLAKGESVREAILSVMPEASVRTCRLDLASMESVREFSRQIGDIPIGGLFNNAGTMNRHFCLSADGIESTMAVNYLGPYLLTRLLLNRFSPDTKVVNMTSLSYRIGSIDGRCLEKGEKDFHQIRSYADSKLALMMFSIELAKRGNFHVNMADPGIVDSKMIHLDRWFDPIADLVFRPFCNTPEKGVRPALAALEADCTMKIFVGSKVKDFPAQIIDSPLLEELWDKTELTCTTGNCF